MPYLFYPRVSEGHGALNYWPFLGDWHLKSAKRGILLYFNMLFVCFFFCVLSAPLKMVCVVFWICFSFLCFLSCIFV